MFPQVRRRTYLFQTRLVSTLLSFYYAKSKHFNSNEIMCATFLSAFRRYITLLLSILDMLEKNVFILDTASVHENLNNLTRLSERHVAIWKPLREVVKKSDLADIDAALPNATINVNAILSDLNTSLCRRKVECQNATVLYNFLSSKRAGKVFRYDPRASKYPSVSDISDLLARSLDVDLINRQLAFWRSEASWDFIWLKQILNHLSLILGEGGNLLDVASKIDFEDVSNVLGVPDLADGIVNILNDKTVDKLFDGYIYISITIISCTEYIEK